MSSYAPMSLESERAATQEEATLLHASEKSPGGGRGSRRRDKLIAAGVIVAAVVIAVAVGTTVGLKNRSNRSVDIASGSSAVYSDPSSSGSSTASPTTTSTTYSAAPLPTNESKNLAVGGDGSTVYLSNGTSFIYTNPYGTHTSCPFYSF